MAWGREVRGNSQAMQGELRRGQETREREAARERERERENEIERERERRHLVLKGDPVTTVACESCKCPRHSQTEMVWEALSCWEWECTRKSS